MKPCLTLVFFLFSLSFFAQDEWASWDNKYTSVKYADVIKAERKYADSIEKDKNIAQYYSRIGAYKLNIKYLGKSRPVDKEVAKSMQAVYKLFIGNPSQLNPMLKNEFLFDVNGTQVWMPVQSVLEADFKKEIPAQSMVTVYCMFLNEHTQAGKLYNIFFISEFRND
ncbi:MAG TPA: hypothetical protein VKG26_06455 [Bacteroidia bacterium]|nr:hypothetical protein [Bacteroidia bacterium]